MRLAPMFQHALAYIFWAVSCALSVFLFLQIYHALSILLGITEWSVFATRAIIQFSAFLMGLGCLIFIIFSEHHYRTGIKKQRLFARFCRVTFIQMVMLLLTHLLLTIGQFVLDLPLGFAWVILTAEAFLCALFYWLYHRSSVPVNPRVT